MEPKEQNQQQESQATNTPAKNKKEKGKEDLAVINFSLAPSQAIWEGRRGDGTTLRLNRFTGQIYGKVTEDEEILFHAVQLAIANGELIDIKKDMEDKIAEREEAIDITNIIEERQTARIKARQYLKTMSVEDLEQQIPATKDPRLIAAMIELESRGINRSKRRRDNIINLLKSRLETLTAEMKSKSAMIGFSEQTTDTYRISTNKDSDMF